MRSSGPAARLVALLLAASTALACGSFHLPFTGGGPMSHTEITEDQLRNELSTFAARFAAFLSDAAEDIASATDQRSIRRRTLIWRMKLVPPVQDAVFAEPPQEGFLRVLGLTIAQTQYLTTGDGRALFGSQQEIAVNAARQMQADAEAIGARLLPPEQLAKVMDEVETLVEKNPIVGRDFSLQRIVEARSQIRSNASLLSVISLPLAPFRALEGVDSGAAAIRDFNTTARQFSLIVAQLPDQLRTQMELLLYDVEDRQTVIETVAAMQSVADSAERASQSIERLPADVQQSLADSRGAIEEANKALLSAKDIAVPLAQATENLKGAGLAWNEVFARDPNAPPSRPFDIREWSAAATQIGTSASELRALAGQLHALSGTSALDAAVDHAAWRAAQVAVLVFVLLVAYRLLAWRFGPARQEG